MVHIGTICVPGKNTLISILLQNKPNTEYRNASKQRKSIESQGLKILRFQMPLAFLQSNFTLKAEKSLNSHQEAQGSTWVLNTSMDEDSTVSRKPVPKPSYSIVGFYSPSYLVRTFPVSICDCCLSFSCHAPQYKAHLSFLIVISMWLLAPSPRVTKCRLFSSLCKSHSVSHHSASALVPDHLG